MVEMPVGAEVSTIPEEAVAHDDEGEGTIYQFDRSFFSKSTNDLGKAFYEVVDAPGDDQITELASD